jgi:hypothetical protein
MNSSKVLPEPVVAVVARCMDVVTRDERHYLELGYRRLIYATLGLDPVEAFARRCALYILSAEKVLPIWERHVPNDPAPREAIAHAKEFVRLVRSGQMTPESAEAFAKEHYLALDGYFLENYYRDPSEEPDVNGPGRERVNWAYVVNCGQTAEALLRDVLQEYDIWYGSDTEPGTQEVVDETLVDRDVDPEERGVEYVAATSWCGILHDPRPTASSDIGGIRARFHEFWFWWLKEAVPTAYGTVSTGPWS